MLVLEPLNDSLYPSQKATRWSAAKAAMVWVRPDSGKV